jgi:hypothetical protein
VSLGSAASKVSIQLMTYASLANLFKVADVANGDEWADAPGAVLPQTQAGIKATSKFFIWSVFDNLWTQSLG